MCQNGPVKEITFKRHHLQDNHWAPVPFQLRAIFTARFIKIANDTPRKAHQGITSIAVSLRRSTHGELRMRSRTPESKSGFGTCRA